MFFSFQVKKKTKQLLHIDINVISHEYVTVMLTLDQTFSYSKVSIQYINTHPSANVTGTFHYIVDQDQASNVIVHNAVNMFLSPLLLLYIQNQLFF